ncbi:MAG: hypothetical protein ACQERD_01755 [Campylobacterota bacterium]
MNFDKLEVSQKETLHQQFANYSEVLGGNNFFLKTVEEIREQKLSPMLNESGIFHTSKCKITLSKTIYKQTLSLLFDAIRREEKTGDLLNDATPKDYKATMNMIKTLKPVTVTFQSKQSNESFSFDILDNSIEKKTKVTFAFKAIFFYNLKELKKVLFYKGKDD